jgi:hypothetical protein
VHSVTKKTPLHISIIFEKDLLSKVENIDEIYELLIGLNGLISVYDLEGKITRRNVPNHIHHIIQDGLLYMSKDKEKLPKETISTIAISTRTNAKKAISKTTAKDPRTSTLLHLLNNQKSTIPLPDIIFVIGGFLLQFHSYPPLMLKNAEFCHIR